MYPTLLFAYRLSKLALKSAAKCIVCDPWPSRLWHSTDPVSGFILDTAEPIRFRQMLVESTDLGLTAGRAELFHEDGYLAGLPAEYQLSAMVAQNCTYLVIDGELKGQQLPFFVSTVAPTKPQTFQATAEFAIEGLQGLPEVFAHEAHLAQSAANKWDRLMLPDVSAEPIRLPVGCLLPGTLMSGDREAGVVYTVSQWLDQRLASVTIYNSDRSVVPQKGTEIIRRFRFADGRVVDARVATVC
jgi:hypothetical protein